MRPEIIEFKEELYEVENATHMQLIIDDAREYMTTLSPRMAEVSKLYFTDGTGPEDIAEEMGMSAAAVRKTISRVSLKLRDRYGT